MAKQSGLHQIRGKWDGVSYYKQTGVSGGLMRSINPGLSARVKNDDAYVNTRKNNSEFAQAGMVAAVLGRMVNPKFRPMFLPFSQANILKDVLALIKSDPTAAAIWGRRGLTAAGITELPNILSTYAKNQFSEIFSNFDCTYVATTPARHTFNFDLTFSSTIETYLRSIGADGVSINFIAVKGGYVRPVIANEYKANMRVGLELTNDSIVEPSAGASATSEVVVTGPSAADGIGIDYALVVAMPFRTIGDEDNILQEYCTFAAIEAVVEP